MGAARVSDRRQCAGAEVELPNAERLERWAEPEVVPATIERARPTGHGRVLGLDAGERRVGVALSDELRLLASPVAVLDRRGGLAPLLDALADLARREGVNQVVVGLPLNADGSHGRQAERAAHFAGLVGRVVGLPVELWDERLSTAAAEDVLRAQGRNLRRARQRGQIDAVAAAVILQDYLDAHASTR